MTGGKMNEQVQERVHEAQCSGLSLLTLTAPVLSPRDTIKRSLPEIVRLTMAWCRSQQRHVEEGEEETGMGLVLQVCLLCLSCFH